MHITSSKLCRAAEQHFNVNQVWDSAKLNVIFLSTEQTFWKVNHKVVIVICTSQSQYVVISYVTFLIRYRRCLFCGRICRSLGVVRVLLLALKSGRRLSRAIVRRSDSRSTMMENSGLYLRLINIWANRFTANSGFRLSRSWDKSWFEVRTQVTMWRLKWERGKFVDYILL